MLPDPPSVDGDPLTFPDRVEAWMDEIDQLCTPSDTDPSQTDDSHEDDSGTEQD
jgi:hypothetical protein